MNVPPILNVRLIAAALIAFVLISACEKAPNKTESASTNEKQSASSEMTDAAKSPTQRYSAEQFFKTTSVSGSSISHDGSAVLVSSDATGVFNVYRYPIDGSAPTQLTNSSNDANFAVSWFPDDDRILFTADQGGNELNHIYVRETDGTLRDLTPGEKLKAQFLGWKNDDSAFYVLTNERDPRGFDLYQYEVKNYTRKLIYENVDYRSVQDISANGRWLVLSKNLSNADSNLYLVDLTDERATPQLITDHEGDVRHVSYSFTPDDTALIYGTNEFGEFNQAWRYNLSDGKKSPYFKADWDVSFVYFSDDGRYRVVGVNNDASTEIEITDLSKDQALTLPELPVGNLRGVNFSDDGKSMVFYLNSDTSPSNLFSYQMGTSNVKQLTQTLNPEINKNDLVSSEVVRFKSFDQLVVPGLLYKPKDASAKNKVPALVWVHGGPGGQSRTGYRAAIQHLVNHGYAIFAVNNRGSSGYGKTFFHLDDRKHGEDDLQDIVYGKKHLQALEWIDPDRIGIIGGSYGGYMTMAGMAFTDEFKVGINVFGVTNWVRTLNSIPPWWESFRKSLYDEMGDPATDGERHRRISPLFHADKISNPVLVVQGANDPRVLQVESDEMVAAIRENDVPVEYVLFDDEGHGFRKKVNRITASNAYLSFLEKYL